MDFPHHWEKLGCASERGRKIPASWGENELVGEKSGGIGRKKGYCWES
jgi:hypothetical protein